MTKTHFQLILAVSITIVASYADGAAENCVGFSTDDGGMAFTVSINNQQYSAAATMSNIPSSISRGLAEELGLTIMSDPDRRVFSRYGEDSAMEYVLNVPVALFGTEVQVKEMIITDATDRSMSISLRLFNGLVLQLNFPQSQLCVYSRDAINLREVQNADMDTSVSAGAPVVNVTLNGKTKAWLELTPAMTSGLNLDRSLADNLGLLSDETTKGIVDSLTFGPYELGNISANFPEAGAQNNSTRNRNVTGFSNIQRGRVARGNIGLEVLKHFVLTMDLEQERLHVFAP